jgi:hypothetical protein
MSAQFKDNLSQREIEKLIKSKRWQDQAYAFALVLEQNLWAKFKKKSGKASSLPYISFSDFCIDQGVSPAKGYKQAELARSRGFYLVNDITMSAMLYKELDTIDSDDLFEILILFKKSGVPDQEILNIKYHPDPMKMALERAKKLRVEIQRNLGELDQFLDQISDTSNN